MSKRVLLPLIFLFLAYILWISSDFMAIAAGVALFMFGMLCLEEGFKIFTGGTLEVILRKSTDRLWKSLAFGITSTTLMQSSTLVSLVTISFVSAEMISLAAGIGVIMGANIGTTTGAWLIAGLGLKVDIAAYAMPMLIFGVLLLMQKEQSFKGIGYLLMGAGFLFLGIHYMKEGFEAFQQSFDLSQYGVEGLRGVLLFTFIGVAVTVVMQSSHATLLIIITALSTGQVGYENALALAIGANLGSAVTTALGGMASNLGGRRLAAAHVLFNVVTALVAITLIGQLAALVDLLARLLGIREDDFLLKLALFHTLFNLLGVVLFTPFVTQLERMLIRVVRGSPKGVDQPLYLDQQALETPATATYAVRKEVERLFDNAFGLLAHGLSLRRDTIDSEESLSEAVKYTRRIFPVDLEEAYEARIKVLHSEIVAFISEAQMRESTRAATDELYVLRQASRDIVEAIKDMKHLHNNLARHGLSTNVAVRERYDQIRLQLARLLRELRQILRAEDSSLTVLSLDALRLSLKRSSQKLIDDLDEMIRHRRIAPPIATSVMNDESYVSDISQNLIDAVQVLIAHRTESVGGQLRLDEQEIEQLAGKVESAG